jgi:hypothetical protein
VSGEIENCAEYGNSDINHLRRPLRAEPGADDTIKPGAEIENSAPEFGPTIPIG